MLTRSELDDSMSLVAPQEPDTSEAVPTAEPIPADFRDRVDAARRAQAMWQRRSWRERKRIMTRVAALIAHRSDQLAALVAVPQRTTAETFASELVPLADAARYLAREAPRLLRPRWEGHRSRPWWALGVEVETRREPWGVVLIVGPSNYPLLLPGVQLLQALMAGNAVLLKPGRESLACAQGLRMLFVEAGGDAALIQLLPEEIASVEAAIQAGVDHVVLTGSTNSGQAVLRLAAESITPTTMELSGCDAFVIQAPADIEIAAQALNFGLTFNGSATCMAPRRVFVHRSRVEDLLAAILRLSADWTARAVEPPASDRAKRLVTEAVEQGARIVLGSLPASDDWQPVILDHVSPGMELAQADLFAPVTSLIPVDDDAQALQLIAQCPYALGAAVFGEPRAAAELARKIPAGCVVVNDVIAPSADPRVSFAGWNQSGFGATRGPEGLLQMTRLKVIVEQRKNWRPHLDPQGAPPLNLSRGLLNFTHGLGWRQRWEGLHQLVRAYFTSRRGELSEPSNQAPPPAE